MSMEKSRQLKEKLWERIRQSGSCWLWTGITTKAAGADRGKRKASRYGILYFDGRLYRAHRTMWELLRDQIPDGYVIDHLCGNTLCVNPSHLEPVTNKENIRRGGSVSAHNSRKTHCPKEHEYTKENTRIDVNGHRHCKKCDEER